MGQLGFFDADKRLVALSARGDPLEAIDHLVPWESFRAEIEAVVLTPDELKKSSALGPLVPASSRLAPFASQVRSQVRIRCNLFSRSVISHTICAISESALPVALTTSASRPLAHRRSRR